MRRPEEREDDEPGQRRSGSNVNWLRDGRNRRYYERGGVRYYRDANDRDEAVEESYRPCACCPSLAVRLSIHRTELAAEYLRWASQNGIHERFDSDTIAGWEEERFGAKAYPAAHGMLMREIKTLLFGPKRPDDKWERAAQDVIGELEKSGAKLKPSEVLAEVISLATDGQAPKKPTPVEGWGRAEESF